MTANTLNQMHNEADSQPRICRIPTNERHEMTSTIRPTLDDMTPAILAAGGRLIPPQGGAPDCGLVPVLDCGPEMPVEVHCWPHPWAHGRLYVSARAGWSRVVVPCPPANLVPKSETLADQAITQPTQATLI